jgi:cardiolipin synthase
VLNVPNTLTLLRILAIPAVLIALDEGQHALAFWLFVAAGVTDGLDGAIARLTDSRTALGSYLDPLADKGLVVTLLVKLTLLGKVPGWALTIILTRDIVCLTGYALLFFLTGERIEIRPTLTGKLATVVQLAGVAVALFSLVDPVAGARIPLPALFGLAAALTAVAGVQYVMRGLTWYQARPA